MDEEDVGGEETEGSRGEGTESGGLRRGGRGRGGASSMFKRYSLDAFFESGLTWGAALWINAELKRVVTQ